MKLKYKISALILIPLLIATIYQIYSYNNAVGIMHDTRHNIVEPSVLELTHAANIRYLSARIDLVLNDMVMLFELRDEKAAKQAIQEYKELQAQRAAELQKIREIAKATHSEKELRETNMILDEVNIAINAELMLNNEIIIKAEQLLSTTGIENTPEEEIHELHKIVKETEIRKAVFEKATKLIEYEHKELQDANELIEKKEKESRRNLYLVAIIEFMMFSSAILILHFWITRPIQKITKAITDISLGKFNAKILGQEKNDEIGDLARAFERTVVSLKLAMRKAGKVKLPEEKEETPGEKLKSAFKFKRELN